MQTNSFETTLACPVWVQFLHPDTRQPYFYNVQTRETSETDPDPGCEQRIVQGSVGQDDASADEAVVSESRPRWRDRPARLQVEYNPKRNTAYVEGNDEYNVWYGKFENDRHDRKEKTPASYRLDPEMDSGWTEADFGGSEKSYFCIFFAQGACSKGPNCQYHHHVPSYPDGENEIVRDIFGRERYSTHRDDMGGVGSFNSDCTTLFIGDLVFDRSLGKTAIDLVEQQIWQDFERWGTVEEVRVIASKAIGFVRFAYRAAAEFAKVAMGHQKLGLAPCITVKWSHDDPNPKAAKRQRKEAIEKADSIIERRLSSMGLSDVELASLFMRSTDVKSCIAPYPDTSSQYPRAAPALSARALPSPARNMSAAIADQGADEAGEDVVAANVYRLSAALARTDAALLQFNAVEELPRE